MALTPALAELGKRFAERTDSMPLPSGGGTGGTPCQHGCGHVQARCFQRPAGVYMCQSRCLESSSSRCTARLACSHALVGVPAPHHCRVAHRFGVLQRRMQRWLRPCRPRRPCERRLCRPRWSSAALASWGRPWPTCWTRPPPPPRAGPVGHAGYLSVHGERCHISDGALELCNATTRVLFILQWRAMPFTLVDTVYSLHEPDRACMLLCISSAWVRNKRAQAITLKRCMCRSGNGCGVPYVAFDLQPNRIDEACKAGFNVRFGDASRPSVRCRPSAIFGFRRGWMVTGELLLPSSVQLHHVSSTAIQRVRTDK